MAGRFLVAMLIVGAGYYFFFYEDYYYQHKYRTTCFGERSYHCENILVKANIELLENGLEGIKETKEVLIEKYSKQGYEEFLKAYEFIMEKEIEKQEDHRPNIFSRTFFGDSQIMSPSGNYLMFDSQIKEIYSIALDIMFVSLEKKGVLVSDQRSVRPDDFNQENKTADGPKVEEAELTEGVSDTMSALMNFAGEEKKK